MSILVQKQPVIQVQRAISDLKNGFIVRLHDDDLNESVLMMASECLTEPSFAEISTFAKLVMPAKRAWHIFGRSDLGEIVDIKLKAGDLSLKDIEKLSCSFVPLEPSLYELTSGNGLSKAAIELTKIAELLPSSVIVESSFVPAPEVLSIKVQDVFTYQAEVSLAMHQICSAPLTLKHALQSHIYAFRSQFGGREHYAIVIGEALKTKNPTVRIHSSCYTGDLLASLTCDCGDQLAGAIEFMGKNGGGIVIYLMQEGRGIGLINKLRTYGLQQQGFDTVDANEILGFSDDERVFLPAAMMLQQFGITSIRLLTNNPRKGQSLIDHGIKVIENLPLIVNFQEHNNSYIKTKATRLGHNIILDTEQE